MKTFRKSLALASVFVAGALCASAAGATPLTITMTQQGSNVVATGGGSVDVTPFANQGSNTYPASLNPGNGFSWILFGDTAGSGYTIFTIAGSGPSGFGTGTTTMGATSTTGDSLGFEWDGSTFYFFLPVGYLSGAPVSASATWANATFASLGVTPGSYTWTWGNGANQMFTVEIGNFSTGVSEPSALAMFGGGLLLLGVFVGLRRKPSA